MRIAKDNTLECSNCQATIGAGEPIGLNEEGDDVHADGCASSFFTELAKPTRVHQPPGRYRGPRERVRTVCPGCKLEQPCDCP